jgi:hypothetical protein
MGGYGGQKNTCCAEKLRKGEQTNLKPFQGTPRVTNPVRQSAGVPETGFRDSGDTIPNYSRLGFNYSRLGFGDAIPNYSRLRESEDTIPNYSKLRVSDPV